MMENKLLACPVCDDAARMRHHATHDEVYPFEHYVSCSRCGLRTRNWRREAQAVEMWNTRPTPTPEALSLEQLMQMDGEPVWVEVNYQQPEDPDYEEMRFGGWHLVNVDEKHGVTAHMIRPQWGHTWYANEYGVWTAHTTKPAKEGEG